MPKPTDQAQPLTSAEVSRIALQAISLLAPDLQGGLARRKHLDVYVNQLLAAALSTVSDGMLDVLRDMRKAQIDDAEIAEIYIPAVARALGADWCDDLLDFGSVTIGTARLQGLLRRIELDFEVANPGVLTSQPGYLIGVPEGTQHTLGVTIVAGHLRRRHAAVRVELDLTPEKVTQAFAQTTYAGVFLSGSGRKCLEPLRDLVDSAKRASRSTPVIIGGGILEQVTDIQSFTGADLVSSGLGGAVEFCEQRLKERKQAGDLMTAGVVS